MTPENDAAARYFSAITAALSGLEVFMARRPLAALPARHPSPRSLPNTSPGSTSPSPAGATGWASWTRSAFARRERFPGVQNLLELENDRRQADSRLANIRRGRMREEMADFILRHKEFPEALQKSMAERLYLEDVKSEQTFGPFTLAQTAKVSVNPKTARPYYLVHWATFDGSANLPWSTW